MTPGYWPLIVGILMLAAGVLAYLDVLVVLSIAILVVSLIIDGVSFIRHRRGS